MGKFEKTKWCLLGCLIILLVFVAGSVFIPNSFINTLKWVASNDIAYKLRTFSPKEVPKEDTLIEMVVERVAVSAISYQPVIILKEKDGEFYLPIWVGLTEADAISVILEGIEMPRPLTPDLLLSIVDRMGASIDYIVIKDIQNETFYASIIVNTNWVQEEIDSRPSDAIAVALRVKAPIYVARGVLEKAGVVPEQEAGEYISTHV